MGLAHGRFDAPGTKCARVGWMNEWLRFVADRYPRRTLEHITKHGIHALVHVRQTGMPAMLKPTSLIMGAGLGHDVACLTDGRFSGG